MFGIRYAKVSPTTYLIQYRNGQPVREGTGLAFFYFAPSASLVSIPMESVDVPFMFRDFEHWKKFSDSDVLRGLMDAYYKKGGNKPLAVTYYGVRHTTANKPINSIADLKGLKMRTPNVPFLIAYAQAVGATPAPVATISPRRWPISACARPGTRRRAASPASKSCRWPSSIGRAST